MKQDEFAFLNQQLASMLRDGIPLEGALRQLCVDLRRGRLRSELEQLETDLGRGVPLKQALAARKLPELYVRMLSVGIQSDNLPGVLTMLADYYRLTHSIGTRLKGLMVYPVIVLLLGLALSVFFAVFFGPLVGLFVDPSGAMREGLASPEIMPGSVGAAACLLMPVAMVATATVLVALGWAVPQWRQALRWRLPGFKEAQLSRLASCLAMLLKGGSPLPEALSLLRRMEHGSRLGLDLSRWEERLKAGVRKIRDVGAGSKVIPPLFLWLVASDEEDWAVGLRRAAELYYDRAVFKTEMLLYAALPVSILGLGLLVVGQVYSVFHLILGPLSGVADIEMN